MNPSKLAYRLAESAQDAVPALAQLSSETKKRILRNVARQMRKSAHVILAANRRDVEAAKNQAYPWQWSIASRLMENALRRWLRRLKKSLNYPILLA